MVESKATEPKTTTPPTDQPPTDQPPTDQPPTDQPPTSQPPTSQPPTSIDLINNLRNDIASTIKTYFPWLFGLTVFVAIFLVGLIAIGFFKGDTMSTAVLAASIQVAFGMVIGFVCVYIGLMMTWFGVDAAYTIKGGLDSVGIKAEGALKSASPGLLFALGGIALIAVSLYKPIVYQQQGVNFSNARSFGKQEEIPKADPPKNWPEASAPQQMQEIKPPGR